MKKLITIALAILACVAAVPARAGLPVFNHLGVGVHAATTGFGFEVASPITKFVTMRAGVSIMPGFSFTTDVDGEATVNGERHYFDMELKAGLKRVQGDVIFNVYPFPHLSSFYVAAGAYFGGNKLIKLNGHTDDLQNLNDANIELGDYEIPVDKDGNVEGSLRVNGFRPYLGLGFGRPVPGKLLNFGVELGVQFMGKSKVYSGNSELSKVLKDNDDDWQKWMDKVTVYPVLKFTLSGKIF